MKILNADAPGVVYYCLHMAEGVAEYRDKKDAAGNPLRILVMGPAIKNMDPTFAGRPVFVEHVDEVDHTTVRMDAAGWVSESFFNKADGKHWAKMIVVSAEAKEKIRAGWRVSNAYHMKQVTGGGRWHGLDYSQEVLSGEYEHLAIVPNPRYDESIILTAEEFKKYNADREAELYKLANASDVKEKQKEKTPMFEFFKKSKVENSDSLEGMSVKLPKSKKEITIERLINEADKAELENGKPYMCNGDERVKVGEEEMSVNELIEKHLKAANTAKPEDKKPENEEAKPEDKKPENTDKPVDEKKPENTDKPEDKKENEESKAEKEKNMNALKNAETAVSLIRDTPVFEMSADKVARGNKRYGSKK